MRSPFAAIIIALVFASPAALAQSGSDTGAGKPSGTSTNSGETRPDTTKNGAGGRKEKRSSVAKPVTSSSGASGERGQRPDAKPASAPRGPKEKTPKRAAPTQTDD